MVTPCHLSAIFLQWCVFLLPWQRLLQEAGVTSVDELLLLIDRLTISVNNLKSKMSGEDEEVDEFIGFYFVRLFYVYLKISSHLKRFSFYLFNLCLVE